MNEIPDWQQRIRQNVMKQSPIGLIGLWAGNTPPEGWAFCDGSSLSVDEYAQLAHALNIGGSNIYLPNLPDLMPGLRYIIRIA